MRMAGFVLPQCTFKSNFESMFLEKLLGCSGRELTAAYRRARAQCEQRPLHAK
jgi:hypothetical protein